MYKCIYTEKYLTEIKPFWQLALHSHKLIDNNSNNNNNNVLFNTFTAIVVNKKLSLVEIK